MSKNLPGGDPWASPLAARPLPGLLFSLALPALLSQLIVLGYNMVDRIYLGHTIAGVISMTAVGVCVPVMTIVLAVVNLFGRGGAPLTSISLGANDRPGAERLIGVSLFWLLISALVCTFVMLAWAEPILKIFGARDSTLEPAAKYLRICGLGNIFLMVGLGLNFFINAQGFTQIGMVTPLIGCGMNILLDPLFIFAFDMGVSGAAVATVISQFLSLLWVLRFFKSPRCLAAARLSQITWRGGLNGKIMLLGSAPAFMVGSEGLLFMFFNLQMARYGSDLAVASMTILAALFQLMLLPMVGIYQGAQPVVGYNYGLGNLSRVKKAILITGAVVFIYAFCLAAFMTAFPGFFVSIFTHEQILIKATEPLLRVYMAGGFFLGLFVVSQDSYNALGNGKLALFFAFFRKIILLIPLMHILPLFAQNKLEAVVLAEAISDIAASIFGGAYFIFYLRKKFGKIRQ